MNADLMKNNFLLIIPSWSELIGYQTLGYYVNQSVSKIISDPVIFLVGAEFAAEKDGNTNYFLFGLGYYYVKFELAEKGSELMHGNYIVDNRTLTCLILSDFVYDHLASYKDITLENDPDVVITENAIKVPIDLSFKSNTQITFIKGALMRNVFIPYKEIILEFLDKIAEPDTYRIERNGFTILSADADKFNQIIFSEKIRGLGETNYLNSIAGINNTSIGSDKFLKQHLSQQSLLEINELISNLKFVYSSVNYDPMYLFSLIENASKKLITSTAPIEFSEINPLTKKNHILTSAENRINEIRSWPEIFKRKSKNDLIPLEPKIIIGQTQNNKDSVQTQPTEEFKEPEREEEFQLRLMKSERVESKFLPAAPEGDIEEIMLYLKYVIEENYEMRLIGEAFERARDNIRKIVLQANYLWEMSKFANLYKKKPPNLALPLKEKVNLLRKIDSWIEKIGTEVLKPPSA
ncbi:MAG: hypothetical protein ACTSPW_16505 [Promethearchaeota archaeon]